MELSKTFVYSELLKPQLNIVYTKVNRKMGTLTIKWQVSGIERAKMLLPNATKPKQYTFISILEVGGSNKVIKHEIRNMEIDQGAMMAKNKIGVLGMNEILFLIKICFWSRYLRIVFLNDKIVPKNATKFIFLLIYKMYKR
jgi:hypothetical protein